MIAEYLRTCTISTLAKSHCAKKKKEHVFMMCHMLACPLLCQFVDMSIIISNSCFVCSCDIKTLNVINLTRRRGIATIKVDSILNCAFEEKNSVSVCECEVIQHIGLYYIILRCPRC